MYLVADEGVDRSVVGRLRKDGHAVDYVAELDPGITDDQVLELATQRGALLITADKDFGERCPPPNSVVSQGYNTSTHNPIPRSLNTKCSQKRAIVTAVAFMVSLCLGWSIFCGVAEASTLPDVDSESPIQASIGLFSLDFDVKVFKGNSLGLSLFALPFLLVGGLRDTQVLTRSEDGRTLALMVSAGGALGSDLGVGFIPGYWVQPALLFSIPLWQTPLTLKFSAGPVISNLWGVYFRQGAPSFAYIGPNFELSCQINPNNALTLGGNSLLSWRGRW